MSDTLTDIRLHPSRDFGYDWILETLEYDDQSSVSKSEVYEFYQDFCILKNKPATTSVTLFNWVKIQFPAIISRKKGVFIGIKWKGSHHISQRETEDVSIEFQLAHLRKNCQVMKRIPKASRKCVADELSKTIMQCVIENDIKSWHHLLLFSYGILNLPNRDEKKKTSLSTHVKRNCSNFASNVEKVAEVKHSHQSNRNSKINSAKNKINEGDIKGAIRILSSSDTMADSSDDTFRILQEKHPSLHPNSAFPILCPFEPPSPVTQEEVLHTVSSFKLGSSAGPDGLRPVHLKDLLSLSNGEAALCLADSIAALSTHMLQGNIPQEITRILYGASLTALQKKGGGIRPIAVGLTFRRIISKIICSRIRSSICPVLLPTQFGFGIKSGAEAIVHAVSSFLHAGNANKIIVKFDFENAFNSTRRDLILHNVSTHLPEFYSYFLQSYRNSSLLFYGDKFIRSEEGIQQGDPCGPLLFCLAIQNVISSLKSKLNCWYLDDGVVGGPIEDLTHDIKILAESFESTGLKLNAKKCEVISMSTLTEDEIQRFDSCLPGVAIPSVTNFTLLGSALNENSIPDILSSRLKSMEVLIGSLSGLPSHQALYILKNCLSLPKLLYNLRTSSCSKFLDIVQQFDDLILSSFTSITNITLNESSRIQSSLPVNMGGIGLILPTDVALPAFLSSINSISSLIDFIISKEHQYFINSCFHENLNLWVEKTNSDIPDFSTHHLQKSWLDPILKLKMDFLCNHDADPKFTARLLASTCKESGAWLHALPSSTLGLMLDDDSLRISAALRLGAPVCQPHTCICGTQVNSDGHHGLCCKKSLGRFPRHAALNDVIKRALNSADIPSVLEPPGTCRDDGKRPDGMTIIPWKNGKSLLWDATCVDTLAASHLSKTSKTPGSAASCAEEKKFKKYESLLDRFIFVPLGFETLGSWGLESTNFIKQLGDRICNKTMEKNSTNYLRQRISIEIQRGNAAAILGTVPSSMPLHEIFFSH